MRVKIIGISNLDAFFKGYRGYITPTELKPVIGLVGNFEPASWGGSEPGYVNGQFTTDDEDFNFYFHAVQVEEIPEKENDSKS